MRAVLPKLVIDLNNARMMEGKHAVWADRMAALGFADFIAAEDGFDVEIRSGKNWLRAKDCGIHVWITDRGEAYAGQAVNVRSRLRQHWKNYRDIAYAALKPVPPEQLDDEEPRLVAAIEGLYPVLNIKFAKSSASNVPLDRLISRDQAQGFLNGDSYNAANAWRHWPLLQRKQARRFAMFHHDELYEEAIEALRIFVERCIPLPPITETRFLVGDCPERYASRLSGKRRAARSFHSLAR